MNKKQKQLQRFAPKEMRTGQFHFVPGDRSKHVLSMACACKPVFELTGEGATIVKHNLFSHSGLLAT